MHAKHFANADRHSLSSLPISDVMSIAIDRAHVCKLAGSGRGRLDDLIATFRHGLVQKARAWKEAVARGLRASVNDSAAAGDHAA
jgi:hypothetical protein